MFGHFIFYVFWHLGALTDYYLELLFQDYSLNTNNMKAMKIVAIALMSALVNVVSAQTTTTTQGNNVAPAVAVLTQQDSLNVANNLPSDSTYRQLCEMLITNGNQPIRTRAASTGDFCKKQVEEGDSVAIYFARTDRGLELHAHTFWRAAWEPKPTLLDTLKAAGTQANVLRSQHSKGEPAWTSGYEVTYPDGTSEFIPEAWGNLYGHALSVGANYQFGNDLNSWSVTGGYSYSHALSKSGKWSLQGEVKVYFRQTKYNENATKEGEKYNALGAEVLGGIGHAFGTHKTLHIYVEGGIVFEHYSTDSKERIFDDGSKKLLQSTTFYPSYTGKVKLEFDPYLKKYAFYLEGGIRAHGTVFQNAPTLYNAMYSVEAGVILKLGRDGKSLK
jgi:hypothetical protein